VFGTTKAGKTLAMKSGNVRPDASIIHASQIAAIGCNVHSLSNRTFREYWNCLRHDGNRRRIAKRSIAPSDFRQTGMFNSSEPIGGRSSNLHEDKISIINDRRSRSSGT